MARGAVLRGGVIDLEFVEYDTAATPEGGVSQLIHRFLKTIQHASGTGDGAIDRVYSATLSVTSSPSSIDLIGALTSQLAGGAAANFADLQWLIVENTSTSGNLQYGGGATPVAIGVPGAAPATAEYYGAIPPGGFDIRYLGTAGLAIGAGTTDLLRVAASTGTVTGRLWAVGRSA